MDLTRKRQIKNTRARFGFALLLVGYCFVAVLTSVPRSEIKHFSTASKPVIVSRSLSLEVSLPSELVGSSEPVGSRPSVGSGESLVKKTLRLAPSKWWQDHKRLARAPRKWWREHKTVALLQRKWWQQHKAVALLQGKWWQQHNSDVGVRSVQEEGTKLVDSRPLLIWKAIAALEAVGTSSVSLESSPLIAPAPLLEKKPFIVASKLITLLVLPATPRLSAVSQSPVAPAPLVEEKPVLVALKPVGTTKRKLTKPRKADWRARVSHASLAPLGLFSMRKPVKKLSYRGYAELLPVVLKSSFAPFVKPQPVERADNFCVSGKIAGWSGIELLPRHKELLEKTNLDHPFVSQGLAARLAAKGFTPGASVFLRLFKDKSELEVWLKKDDRFALYRTYKICRWSGSFGPKLYEGDKQSPEGFYLVDRHLFKRPSWKWKDSFSIGYPNAYDKLHGRTGSLILVHGGCTSSGCFAMTDPVIQEVHELAQLAREKGQKKFSVHVYPFKLTNVNLEEHKDSPWMPFWNNLKEGYDLFEQTGLPPKVRVCHKRYVFAPSGVKRSGAGWSGKGCYGLADRVPGWRAARRFASKGTSRRARRASRRARRVGVKVRCNINRSSCRKWVALQRKKTVKHRRKSRKRRVSTIGRKTR